MGESYRRGALKLTTCHPGPCVPVTHPVGAPEGPQGSSLRRDNNPRVLRPCFWSHSKGLFFQGLAGAELVPNVTRFSSSVLSLSPQPPGPVSSRSSLEFCEENLPTRPVGGARPFPQWEASPSSGIKRLLFFFLLLLLLHPPPPPPPPFFFSFSFFFFFLFFGVHSWADFPGLFPTSLHLLANLVSMDLFGITVGGRGGEGGRPENRIVVVMSCRTLHLTPRVCLVKPIESAVLLVPRRSAISGRTSVRIRLGSVLLFGTCG